MRDKFIPAQASILKLVAEGNKDEATLKFLFSIRALQLKYLGAMDKFVESQHALMVSAGERSKFVNQLGKFGEIFVNVGALKKGDQMHMDWVPGTGT